VISAKGTRVAGTCEWITHNESYRAWLGGGGSRLLWISGGPGKGKTMMSVFLTEELEKRASSTDNAQSIFCFCSYQDDKCNTGIAVLRGLVHQIVTKRPGLVKHALPFFETPERTQQTVSSLETLWVIFSKLVGDADLGNMFCVLDGLDECDEGTLRALVPKMVGLFSPQTPSPTSTSTAFRLVIVSRDMLSLRGCVRVKLDPDNNEKVASDIERFISMRVDDLSKIEGFNDEIRTAVQTTLLKRAEGTFLWVGFAMDELLQKWTCTEVLKALEGLPSGLPAIYGRMLLQIPVERRQTSSLILRWVTMALRPLKLQELAEVLDVQPSLPLITIEHATRDAIAQCGPLLTVQEQDVRLVHQSARDYLLRRERSCNAVLEEFRIEPERAHLELAQSCLRYIAHSSLQYKALDLTDESFRHRPSFLRYAVLQWPEHARSCSELAVELFSPPSSFPLTDSTLRENWFEAYLDARAFSTFPTSLFDLACYIGVGPWVRAIITQKSQTSGVYSLVNRKDDNGWTALHFAANRGHEAVVQLLLNKGADINAKTKTGTTALHIAAQRGSEVVVRLLIDRGADVEAKDNRGEMALHRAARGGKEAVVRLLIDSGADFKAKDEFGGTVLHWAARAGNEVVVRLLISRGADVKAKNNSRETVLHWAAWGGYVRMIVNSGADVNAKDMLGKTASLFAAQTGNEAVVRLLVDSGADVKAKDMFGKTALYWAGKRRNKAIVRLLEEALAA
jgi:ankyrin repeat protein